MQVHTQQVEQSANEPLKFISPKETANILGISLATLYRYRSHIEDFPRLLQIGPNRTAFIENEVTNWMTSRPEAT